MPKETYSKPSDVVADGGMVWVDGPDHVHVGLTPEAAAETGRRLIEQSAIARAQPVGPGMEPERD
jgi:hypothetical protein